LSKTVNLHVDFFFRWIFGGDFIVGSGLPEFDLDWDFPFPFFPFPFPFPCAGESLDKMS
jgi:hypothetical protein